GPDPGHPGAQLRGRQPEQALAGLGVLEVVVDEAALLCEIGRDRALAGAGRPHQDDGTRETVPPPPTEQAWLRELGRHPRAIVDGTKISLLIRVFFTAG